MRVTLRYETGSREPLVIRITLSDKHVQGMTGRKLFDMFAKQFSKKFSEDLDGEKHYLKIVGGRRLAGADLLADYCSGGSAHQSWDNVESEIFVLEEGQCEPAAAAAAQSGGASSSLCRNVEEAKASAENDQKIRCKNFGCNLFFDSNENTHEQGCRHHKSAPIFHETAKWWSCCPSAKAYDWDEFQRIPGCQLGLHSSVAAKKQTMGGVDLRAGSTPQRIDGGQVTDPRKKLEMLRSAMLAVGVQEDFFDRAWGKLAAKHGSLDTVCAVMRAACEQALSAAVDIEPPEKQLGEMD